MRVAEPILSSWKAELALGFAKDGDGTVLARRRHDGPLVVQKALYPEGRGVCHAIVVHPPGGIAGGDELALDIEADAGTAALLTTPGAGKWYRSAGARAKQHIRASVAEGATLEWLPQETIVFDGALAGFSTEVDLARGAGYLGWEIVCLGRSGSGERYTRGDCRFASRVSREGRPLWLERGRVEGGGALMASPAGLAGQSVFGTFVAAFEAVDQAAVDACRELAPAQGEGSVTRLPGVLIARYLGASSEAARHHFIALWRVLRPALAGRAASEPRIWRT